VFSELERVVVGEAGLGKAAKAARTCLEDAFWAVDACLHPPASPMRKEAADFQRSGCEVVQRQGPETEHSRLAARLYKRMTYTRADDKFGATAVG
jgi:hypothetical protein